MSTTYEPKLLVGNYLSDVEILGNVVYKGDRWRLREVLEDKGMLYIEDCDFVGFEVDESATLDVYGSIEVLAPICEKFEEITGICARLKACVYKY